MRGGGLAGPPAREPPSCLLRGSPPPIVGVEGSGQRRRRRAGTCPPRARRPAEHKEVGREGRRRVSTARAPRVLPAEGPAAASQAACPGDGWTLRAGEAGGPAAEG